MKFLEYLLENKEGECETPGAVYSTEIDDNHIKVMVKMPKKIKLNLSPEEAKKLENDLHYAIEEILAPFFKKS